MKLVELKKMGFSKVGEIVASLKNDIKVEFRLDSNLPKCPQVYLWIDVIDNTSIVLYCGRAGKGVQKRMYEHSKGFQLNSGGSISGRKKHDIIQRMLEKGSVIEVWAKDSKDEKLEEGLLLNYFAKRKNNWLILNSFLHSYHN